VESFFSSLKIDRAARRMCRSRDDGQAAICNYVDGAKSETPTLDDRIFDPMAFERLALLAKADVNRAGLRLSSVSIFSSASLIAMCW